MEFGWDVVFVGLVLKQYSTELCRKARIMEIKKIKNEGTLSCISVGRID